MTKEDIERLDCLREEKKDLEYFLSSSGNFGIITQHYILFKHFMIGEHRIETSKNVTDSINKMLNSRLDEINKEIEGL